MKDEGFLKQGRELKCWMEMRSCHRREGLKQQCNGTCGVGKKSGLQWRLAELKQNFYTDKEVWRDAKQ